MLRSNPAELTGLFIDQCYAASAAVAHAFFQVTRCAKPGRELHPVIEVARSFYN